MKKTKIILNITRYVTLPLTLALSAILVTMVFVVTMVVQFADSEHYIRRQRKYVIATYVPQTDSVSVTKEVYENN